MAIRAIRREGDEVLTKKCKKVDEITNRVKLLLDDMADTMYTADGVGLAAPQIGVLKRLVVIDIGEGLIELINPEIIEESGSQFVQEGCLSAPKIYGDVLRPAKVKVKALDRDGQEVIYVGEELLARAFCHEIDHLNGIMFTSKAENIEKVK